MASNEEASIVAPMGEDTDPLRTGPATGAQVLEAHAYSTAMEGEGARPPNPSEAQAASAGTAEAQPIVVDDDVDTESDEVCNSGTCKVFFGLCPG